MHTDPKLVKLQHRREQYKAIAKEQGFASMKEASYTSIFNRYSAVIRKINNRKAVLRHQMLVSSIQDFHDSINGLEIDQ